MSKKPNSCNCVSINEDNLEPGKKYYYQEGSFRGEIIFLEDLSDDNFFEYKIKMLEGKDIGKSIVISHSKTIQWQGMWYITNHIPFQFSNNKITKEDLLQFSTLCLVAKIDSRGLSIFMEEVALKFPPVEGHPSAFDVFVAYRKEKEQIKVTVDLYDRVKHLRPDQVDDDLHRIIRNLLLSRINWIRKATSAHVNLMMLD